MNTTLSNNPSLPSTPVRAGRVITWSLAGAALALIGGCVASWDDESQGVADLEIVEYTPEILGDLELADGVRVTFTASPEPTAADTDPVGPPVIAIETVGPDSAFPYLEHLRDRQATSLEAFLALAPAGSEAPAALRDAHEREARTLDRSSEVREFSLAGVDKATPFVSSTCNSFAAFQGSLSSWFGVQTSSSTQNHSLTHPGGTNVLASMCNYNSASQYDYKYAQFCLELPVQGSPFGLLSCEPKIIVPDGYRVNKAWLGATSKRVVRAEKLANYGLTVTSYIGIGGYVVP